MTKFHLLAASAAFAAVPLMAQPTPTFDAGWIDRDVKTLSSDTYQGRAPATPGEQMTVDYLVKALQQSGVQPGGEVVNGQRQWTQRVPLMKSDFTATPSVTLTFGGQPHVLTQGEQIAVGPPMNGQERVTLTNAPLLFVGYGVHRPRARLGRLQGPGRARQGDRRSGQRSRFRSRCQRSDGRRFRRQGDDLLRPLDLQI